MGLRDRFFLSMATLLVVQPSLAVTGPSGISYEGRLYDQQGAPATQTVKFVLSIYNPAGTCLLRTEETAAVDLSQTDGFFSVAVGQGTTISGDPGLAMTVVFANRGTITGADGCSYTPTTGDGRVLRVSVKEGSTTTAMTPDISIGATPYALTADSLQGKLPGDFIQVNSSTAALTQANLESIFFNSTYVSTLGALIAGTSTKYVKSSSSGAIVPNVATTPTSPTKGQFWYDTTSNTLKFYNGTAVQSLSTGGGASGISSITAGTGLTGGTITSSGTLAVNVGTGASQIVQLDAAGMLPAVDASQLTNLNAANITTGTIPAARLPASVSPWNVSGSDLNYTAGKVGIGVAAPTAPLDVLRQYGSASGVVNGLYSKTESTYTGGSYEYPSVSGIKGEAVISAAGLYNASSEFVGVKGSFSKAYGANSSIFAQGYGVYGLAKNSTDAGQMGTLTGVIGHVENNYGAGTVTGLYGVTARMLAAGTVSTEAIGVYVWPQLSGVSTPDAYGIKIKDIDGGTNQWGIYQVGTDDKNYFGGKVGIGTTTPSQLLQVGASGDGSVALANYWNTFSDARLKDIISRIPNACEMVEQMNGYYYTWKTGADRSRQVGVIAQEVEAVLPELVKTNGDGIKTVDYSKLSAVLIEAVKELRGENDAAKAETAALRAENEALQDRLEAIENKLGMSRSPAAE